MNSIIDYAFHFSGVAFIFKMAIHLYINYKLIPNYQPVNRGVFGTDLGLLMPISFTGTSKYRWLIRLGNVMYYICIVSSFFYLMKKHVNN